MGQSGAKDNFSIADEKRTDSINSKAESKVSEVRNTMVSISIKIMQILFSIRVK